MDTFLKHQVNIAIKTLKMSDTGAFIMGGMTKAEARDVLRKAGWKEKKIMALSGYVAGPDGLYGVPGEDLGEVYDPRKV